MNKIFIDDPLKRLAVGHVKEIEIAADSTVRFETPSGEYRIKIIEDALYVTKNSVPLMGFSVTPNSSNTIFIE